MERIKNILLVDDDAITNHINKMILRESSITENIYMALNGEEALDFIKNNCSGKTTDVCPTVVFLDLNMPVMDGFEFLESFESLEEIDKKEIIIFVLTSSENSSDIAKAEKFRISGYVNKPLTPEKVGKAIYTALN